MVDSNKSDIKGDNNKVIQGLKAGGDITINYGSDLDPKVKKEKEKVGNKIEELVGQLREIEEHALIKPNKEDKTKEPDSANYKDIDWQRLVKAIKRERCVLFIGPEISVDEKGKSIHEAFYKQQTKKHKGIEYHEVEGLFSPKADKVIELHVIDFYEEEFQKSNKIGRRVLENFVQIPFSLIISLCPDDTIHKIFDDFDMKHQYLYYEKDTRKETDRPSRDNPVIYNILGHPEKDGRYIYTHENFYKYLNNVRIPSEIKKKINDAADFIFIGFDFNKWYNRLLLFVLKLGQKEDTDHRINIEKKEIAEEFEKFINKQFSITSVRDDYTEFAGLLIKKAKEVDESIIKDLSQNFIKNKFDVLEKLGRKVNDEKLEDPLHELSKEADSIGSDIDSFKQLMS